MKNKRDDFTFKVHINQLMSRIDMSLEIINGSPNDYRISKHILLIEGLVSRFFSIIGPSDITCHKIGTQLLPTDYQYVEIKSGHKVSNTITLSEICDTSHAAPGIYTVRFNTYFDLYEGGVDLVNASEYSWMIGSDTFVIGDSAEDIALKSLTYESAL